MAINAITSVLEREGQGEISHIRESDVTMEGETAVMLWLNVKECWQPPETARGKKIPAQGNTALALQILIAA